MVEDISVIPPHEALGEEFAANPDLASVLDDAIRKNELPPCYYTHAVVQNTPSCIPVYPLAIYMDGVSFVRNDGVLGVWVWGRVGVGMVHQWLFERSQPMRRM